MIRATEQLISRLLAQLASTTRSCQTEELFQHLITVSLETMEIFSALPPLDI